MSHDHTHRDDSIDSDGYTPVERLTLKRDGDGELIPQDYEADSIGRIRVLPMPYGTVEEKFGSGTSADVTSDDIAALLEDHLVEPDLSAAAGGRVTGQYVRENLKPMVPAEILMAIMDVSGVDADVMMNQAGGATVELEEGNRR